VRLGAGDRAGVRRFFRYRKWHATVELLHRALGAGPPAGVEQITLFIPSVDRHGRPIDQDAWTDDALATFGRLFRGATSFPPGRGVWRDDDRGGLLVFDDTRVVTSFAPSGSLADRGVLRQLRSLVRRLGRDARQGEVGMVIDGTYFGIVDFGGR
jgi:hypothetical protein